MICKNLKKTPHMTDGTVFNTYRPLDKHILLIRTASTTVICKQMQ